MKDINYAEEAQTLYRHGQYEGSVAASLIALHTMIHSYLDGPSSNAASPLDPPQVEETYTMWPGGVSVNISDPYAQH